jgi:hypothetical protein
VFLFSGDWETPTLFGPLEGANLLSLVQGPNRAGVSHSPDDGDRASFRNIVFSSV